MWLGVFYAFWDIFNYNPNKRMTNFDYKTKKCNNF